MRCHGSICRWSPFFGICASKLMAASGCTMNGANIAISAAGFASSSFCQWASAPSPRQETMPIPVIQASRAPSAIRRRPHRVSNFCGGVAHAASHLGIGEGQDTEREGGVAHGLAVCGDAGFGHGVTRTVMVQLGGDRQHLSGRHEGAQFCFLHRSQKRHSLEAVDRDHQPAGRLRHGFDQQYAGHQRITRKVPFEDRAGVWNSCFGSDRSAGHIQLNDPVDQLKILKPHGRRCSYAPLAATSSSMRALRFLSTKYWSVVALPSLTSCVHCSSGSLMPKALSMAKAMSRKSRLSMPRSLMAWLSGLIDSRGISHVSAIILAMVSNVEDIGNSLIV